jgi:ligand-binding SRPBCC domain-containing protein
MSRVYTLERTTLIRAPLADVFDFFSDPRNLAVLTPADLGFRIIAAPPKPMKAGDTIDYVIKPFLGIPVKWRTVITEWQPGVMFADAQARGPYRSWLHTHTFRETADGVVMHDDVKYELPLGVLGRLFGAALVRRQLEAIFAFRAAAIAKRFGSS